jgi:hypothetical protein
MKKTVDQMLAAQRSWAPRTTILRIDSDPMQMSKVVYVDGTDEWCTPLQLTSWAARVEGVDGPSSRFGNRFAAAR